MNNNFKTIILLNADCLTIVAMLYGIEMKGKGEEEWLVTKRKVLTWIRKIKQ
mgnify:CR=1 FL=1